MDRRPFATLFLSVVLAAVPGVAGATVIEPLRGKVVSVTDAEVRLSVAGNLMPQPGDEVTLSFRIPGGPAVKLGTWKVSRVLGDDVFAQRQQATGTPAAGHDAVFVSPTPVPRQKAPPVRHLWEPPHGSEWIISWEGREYRARYEMGVHQGTPIDLYYYRLQPGPGAPIDATPWGRFVRMPSVRHTDQSSVEWWHGAVVWRDGAWKDEGRRGLKVELRKAD